MAIFQDNRQLVTRLGVVRFCIALTLVLLGGKLWHMTILRYEFYREQAERNQIRTIPEPAPRGLIYDRENRILVDNIHTFSVLLYRDEVADLESTVDFLVEGLGIERSHFTQRLQAAESYSRVRPVVMADNLKLDQAAYLLAHQVDRPELRVVEHPTRRYRFGDLAAHVLGYVGEVSAEQLTNPEFADSRAGDIVGRYGLERQYNKVLTGRDGHRRVLVNSLGKTLEMLQLVRATEGAPLHTTLDLDLQWAAEEILEDHNGSVIALDPDSGEILALASSPAFDPNLFATRLSLSDWKAIAEDEDHPLQNRAIQSAFPPGSIFKVTMALAGLQTGVVDLSTRVFCNGRIELYDHPFRCWNPGGHGWVTMREALQHSCNIYFYRLGQQLGIDQIHQISRQLGLGQLTGIDLKGEVSGLVPSDDWKRKTTGQPWYPGETISVAIGQGPINTTPMQLARMMALIATGRMTTPHLLQTDDGADHATAAPQISLELINVIREGLWRSVNQFGTGQAARVANLAVCGKTGTVQTVSQTTLDGLSEEEKERFQPNAWFVGFAPRDDPEIVVAITLERAGSGSTAAAPAARKLFEVYAHKKQQMAKPTLSQVAMR